MSNTSKLRERILKIVEEHRHSKDYYNGEFTDMIMKELNLSFGDYASTDVNFNHAHEQAIRALRYIGEHGKTPGGGSEFPNDECCFQVADELERSFKPIKRLFS